MNKIIKRIPIGVEVYSKRFKEKYAEQIFEMVNKLSKEAWQMGIDIVSIRLNPNIVRRGTKKGDELFTIQPPEIKEINTPYMSIKVVK